MATAYKSKQEARQAVWKALAETKAARFPFPVEGRIPNFAGAKEAAQKLFEHPLFAKVKNLKVNPDSPQKFVREEALRRGMVVYMPTPRLRAGFRKLEPEKIPSEKITKAAQLSHSAQWSEEIALKELPEMDLIVAGSVAVTRQGRRCGKGHGYGDLEYSLLRELGYPPVPVVTTVHPLQVVSDFPVDEHDLPVRLIATPDEIIEVSDPPPAPEGINWDSVTEEMLDEMPILQELKALSEKKRT